VNEYSALDQSVRSEQTAYDTIRDIASEAVKSVEICQTKIDAIKSNLAGLSSTNQDTTALATATKYVNDYEEHQKTKTTFEGKLEEATSQLEKSEKSLAETREKAERSAKFNRYAEFLEFARNALHRDNFPSGKVKAFIDRTLMNADTYLESMNAGFAVSFDNEDGFSAYFPGKGTVMRADRLSGGEKVVFSLGFRFAVNEIKSETGFLILDEPTAHLDDDHVDAVVEALSLVKQNLAGRVQTFIITHNDKICTVADKVIEINSVSEK